MLNCLELTFLEASPMLQACGGRLNLFPEANFSALEDRLKIQILQHRVRQLEAAQRVVDQQQQQPQPRCQPQRQQRRRQQHQHQHQQRPRQTEQSSPPLLPAQPLHQLPPRESQQQTPKVAHSSRPGTYGTGCQDSDVMDVDNSQVSPVS